MLPPARLHLIFLMREEEVWYNEGHNEGQHRLHDHNDMNYVTDSLEKF